MDKERLERLLKEVKKGKIGVDEALNQLRSFPYEDLGFAKLDEHRGYERVSLRWSSVRESLWIRLKRSWQPMRK